MNTQVGEPAAQTTATRAARSPRHGSRTEPCRSSPRDTFRGARSCRARASRWRCRCSTPWCRRARCWRRRPPRRRADSSASSSRTAWRPATGSRRPRARCRTSCPTSSSRSRSVKDQTVVLSGLWSQSAEPPEGTTGSDHWVAAAFLTGIKPRKTAGSDATVGSADDRSDHRAEDRPGHAAAVAAARGRGSRTRARATAARATAARTRTRSRGSSCRRRARRNGAAHQPAADGAEPAGRLRAAVRQRLHAGSARAAHEAEPAASSTRWSQELAGLRKSARARPTCARSTSTPTRSARSSAASSSRPRPRTTCRSWICRRAFPSSSTSTSGCTRTCSRWRSRPTSPAWRRCSARAT